MTSDNIRGCLRRAAEEIEDISDQVSDAQAERLSGLAEQLRYHVEGSTRDPEALAGPDPRTLDTIRDHIIAVKSDTEGDVPVRLDRASDEILNAISVLRDRQEKQKQEQPGNGSD